MTISLRADISGTSGAIQVGGVDKVTINSSGQVAATSFSASGAVVAASFSGDGSALTGITTLPTQTGNSGKYLTTNGTAASWGTLDFTSSLSTSGYQKLPSGLIIQWGTAPQSYGATVSFPIAFPNAVLQAVATSTLSASNSMAVVTALTTSQITLYNNNNGGTVRWVAFGY